MRKFLLAISCFVSLAVITSAAAKSSSPRTGSHASSGPLAPEFGPSVVFDQADLPVQLTDLRGKMVVVVFFQSWCPICNGWSPDMLQQVTQVFGDDPAVALVAIKVDGGTPAEAKEYLRSKKADLTKWTVASDTGGVYYQRVAGTNALWGYALIDGDGRLVGRGDAGGFYPGATKKYVLADAGLKKKAPNAAAIFPAEATTPLELKPIAQAAEMGHYALALRALKTWDHGKTKEPSEKMRDALLAALAARVEKATADFKSDDIEARYDGYRVLRSMSVLSDTPAGKSAKEALASLKTDKTLAKDMATQERAESAFWQMIIRSEHMEIEQRKTQLPDAMKQFAGAFTGTMYADRAMAEAQTIAKGTLAP